MKKMGKFSHKHSVADEEEGKPRNGRKGSTVSVNRRPRIPVPVANNDESNESHNHASSQAASGKSLADYLRQLDDKNKAKREEGIWGIVVELTHRLEQKFAENNFATLLYHCLCFVRKGTAKNVGLAAQAIGLLGMIIVDAVHAHEVYEDSLPVFVQALRSSVSKSSRLEVIDSLAVTTFFGAINSGETEETMQIMWELFNPNKERNSSAHAVAHKPSADVVAAAISAWSFLLSTMESWNLSHKLWQDTISCFSNLLDEESDETVSRAAAEALSLILEINCLDKFSSKEKDSASSSSCAGTPAYAKEQKLKDNVAKRLRHHAAKGKADLNGVLKFLEGSEPFELRARICKNELVLSSWSQAIQLNFMKRFLGEDGGFVKHMMENDNLHRIFEYIPKGKAMTTNQPHDHLWEDVVVRCFLPKPRSMIHEDCSLLPYLTIKQRTRQKRSTQSPSTLLSKAKTQLLNKKRMLKHVNVYGDF